MHKILTVIVDYTLSYREMIAAGAFAEVVGDGPMMNHPNRLHRDLGKVEVKMRIIQTSKPMSRDDISLLLHKQHLRLADIRETLALSAQFPEEHRERPVIGLGNTCDCGRFLSDVVALASGPERAVYVGRCNIELPPGRVAAVVL